ncbi:MAG: hypothetical protein ACP5KE_06545 [Candidatus Methanodesulfokora sp.]|jgi:hypothetical protein
MHVTTKGIEAFLLKHPYRTVRVPEKEEKVQGKIMAEVFDRLANRGKLVSQFRFAHLVNRIDPNLYYRAARAWASFMSEYHFFQLLREGGFDVNYSLEEDFSNGVDIVIFLMGKTLRLHCYYSTKKAEEFAEIKKRRHPTQERVEFPLYEQEARVVGNVHLYTEEHIKRLQEMVRGSAYP